MRHEGARPQGWLGPWIAETAPWLSTRRGRILALPYPQELNDSSTIIGRRASAAEFADMFIDQFEEMLAQSQGESLVMGIALHAYIVGQPFRLRHLRRALAHIAGRRDRIWLATAGALARHCAALAPQPPQRP